MKTYFNIPELVSSDLTSNQINSLYELTELQLKWLNMYYPNVEIPFSKLLKLNHKKILYFITIELQGSYIEKEIDRKFDRMFNAYNSLFEISKLNRENGIKINNGIIDGKIY